MYLVKPSYEIWSDDAPAAQRVERAARVCYKSENRITGTSADAFCRKLITQLKHESVLEHVSLGFFVSGSDYIRLHCWPFSGTNNPVTRAHLRLTYPIVSGNLRAWRDVLRLRTDLPGIAAALVRRYPLFFADIVPDAGQYNGPMPQFVEQYPETALLDHGTQTVKFIVDRGVSHEIVRHRVASYSQESTRYCNYGKIGNVTFVIPPWLSLLPGTYTAEAQFGPFDPVTPWYSAMLAAEQAYLALLKSGWSPQQARAVLPNSLKTELVMTATFREWRHVFALRTADNAHPQMREVMCPLFESMQAEYPRIFNG